MEDGVAVDGLSITLAALPTASLSLTAAFRAFIATLGRLSLFQKYSDSYHLTLTKLRTENQL